VRACPAPISAVRACPAPISAVRACPARTCPAQASAALGFAVQVFAAQGFAAIPVVKISVWDFAVRLPARMSEANVCRAHVFDYFFACCGY